MSEVTHQFAREIYDNAMARMSEQVSKPPEVLWLSVGWKIPAFEDVDDPITAMTALQEAVKLDGRQVFYQAHAAFDPRFRQVVGRFDAIECAAGLLHVSMERKVRP